MVNYSKPDIGVFRRDTKIHWDTANELRMIYLQNRSGQSVTTGEVVVWDTANPNSFKLTTTEGDVNVCGVIAQALDEAGNATTQTIANLEWGWVQTAQRCPKVKLTTTASVGDFIQTSTIAGLGKSSPEARPGSFAIALTSGTEVECLIWILSPSGIGLNIADGLLYTDFTTKRVGVNTKTPSASLHNNGDFITKGPQVDVRAYGAKGDGVTDDTTAIQSAIDNSGTGSTIYFPKTSAYYKVTAQIAVNKELCLRGDNTEIRQTTGETTLFNISASNVVIKGFKLVGPQFTTEVVGERAIDAQGTSASAPISNLVITGNELKSWGQYGIYLKYVTDFRIERNSIKDIYYAAIMGLSVIDGSITNNSIENIVGTGYGIAVTREEVDSLTTDPRSSNVIISNNYVKDVTNWKGLDTHGGERITFLGNIVKKCKIGIAAVAADGAGNVEKFAPLQVVISNNIIDSETEDGSADSGIKLAGAADSGEKATGIIQGNYVKRHGNLYLRHTQGITVNDNTIIEPNPHGIDLYLANSDFLVMNNTIIDSWTDDATIGCAIGIYVRSYDNKGFIGGNVLAKDKKTATYVLTEAIRVADFTTNEVLLGINYSEADTFIKAPGWRLQDIILNFNRLGLNTQSPGAKIHLKWSFTDTSVLGLKVEPSSSVTATGAYYLRGITSEVTEMVNAGITNSGYITGLWANTFAGNGHSGTLENIYGAVLYAGIDDSLDSGGSVNTARCLQLRIYANGGSVSLAKALEILNPYIAGVNGTITTSYAIYQAGASDLNYFAGSIGVGTASIPNILTIVQNSTTDPIADAWTTYSTKKQKRDLRIANTAPYFQKFLNFPIFSYKLGSKSKRKKFRHTFLGLIAEQAPEFLQSFDEEENLIGLNNTAYIGWLHAILFELVKRLKEKKLI